MKFCINRGRRCAQTVIRSIVYEEQILSWSALDKLTGRARGQITTPIQIAFALHQMGKNFIYPVKQLFFSKNFSFIKEKTLEVFGNNIVEQSNFKFIENAIKVLGSYEKYLLDNSFNFEKIISYCNKGIIPICLINYDTFTRRINRNNGHYLIINDISQNFAKIFDPGPADACPNRIIPLNLLKESVMETPIDYGVVFANCD